jgi:cobalt-zinc-cadmium efflux system outer membrane protein
LEAFKTRRAAWPQVLVAQREYFQLTDEYLEALLELRDAGAEITGMFLGDGLDAPPVPEPQGHREATPRPR